MGPTLTCPLLYTSRRAFEAQRHVETRIVIGPYLSMQIYIESDCLRLSSEPSEVKALL